jgi:hypothetical protein
LAAIRIIELKVDYKRNPSYMTDFVKLVKQIKLILHELTYADMQAPVVCGILIQGKKRMSGYSNHVLFHFYILFFE